MAINGISSGIPKLRLSGLATGLDTDQIIKDLMSVERIPLNKLNLKKQLSEWKRDEYRNITNLLRSFKDEFFNFLKPGNLMLSESTFKRNTVSASPGVSAAATAEAIPGTYKITVDKLATSASAQSNSPVTAELSGNAISSYELSGKKIKVTLDGVTKELVLVNYTPGTDEIVTASNGLQSLVDSAFGAGKINVSYDSGKITFSSVSGTNRITLSSGTGQDAISDLGFASGASNRLNIYASLEAMKDRFANPLTFETFTDSTGATVEGIQFKINGKTFSFSKDTSISRIMSTINNDQDAGMTMRYDEISDKFIVAAKQTGAGDNIIIDSASQKGNFFGATGATRVKTGITASNGEDAQFRLGDNPQVVTRSSNTFNINGVIYTLLKESSEPQAVTVSRDTEGVLKTIKTFVEKYNELTEKINTELSEKYDRSFLPLTDEQKKDMEPEDIKKWEEKAKTGLLRNDPLLADIVTAMRRALVDKVEGVGISLSDIGITTGAYYTKGKLSIDETKLKDAINNKPDEIASLFSSENGLAKKLSAIVEKNIRTTRDSNDKKGLLLEKAGIQGDMSEFKNIIYDEISDYDKRINSLADKLLDKEDNYYKKYAALEKAISQMNNQSSWLASQFNNNQ